MSMDIAAISSIRAKDKHAFQLVFDEYFNALCAFSYRYIGDKDEVEDIVQEVFISFWEHAGEFDHINAVKSFLYTSARNKCLNHLKHRTVRQKHEEELIKQLESDQFYTQHIIEEEAFNQLYIEIGQLPSAAQKIMLLVLKGYKNKEIADKLGVSENTVKTQKKIAYSRIKTGMQSNIHGMLLALW